MPTINPRINVTFNPNDAEILKLISNKKHLSMSALIRKVMEDWLEEYEDLLLAKRAEEVEKQWLAGGCKTISHEELCQDLGIESSIAKTPLKTLKGSRKTSKKESLKPSKKGLSSRRKQVNH